MGTTASRDQRCPLVRPPAGPPGGPRCRGGGYALPLLPWKNETSFFSLAAQRWAGRWEERGGKQEAVKGKDRGSDSDLGVGLQAAARRVGAAPVGPGSCALVPPSGPGSSRRASEPGLRPSRPASLCLSLLSCGAQAPAPLFLEPCVS